MKTILVFAVVIISCRAQEPFDVGRLPTINRALNTVSGLGSRLGEPGGTTSSIRMPVEALGDPELMQRLNKLPVDQQPYWLINWNALQEYRNHPPQSFPQRDNSLVDDDSSNSIS